MISSGLELTLSEKLIGRFSAEFYRGETPVLQLPAVTPAEALIATAEIDYASYRKEVQRLWHEHPLFEERPIIRVEEPRSMKGVSRADFDDFIAQASALLPMLQDIDPLAFAWIQAQLEPLLHAQDNGTAMFLLNTGGQILKVLGEPFLAQTYLRNILEITFDGMERASQQERFEKLRQTYPDIAQRCNPTSLDDIPEGDRIFTVHDLFGLYLLELALYFSQDKQRIARCDYCWRYFIPKTKKATRYCDRMTDGQICKQRGANLARLEIEIQDEALLIYNKLRERMYARHLRWKLADPWDRDRLIPMDYDAYNTWSDNARLARTEYLRGDLSAEAFLRKVDITHELTGYEASKAELVEESPWQNLVARRWSFDPEEFFPEEMMVLDMTPGEKNEWEILTRDDLRRRFQEGHQSLREKYGKDRKE